MHPRPDLLRLLHDPLSYYRPWQHTGPLLAPAQRGALNAWLVEWFALPGYSPPSPSQVQLTQRLVQAWTRLPAAAYLLACGKQRQRVLGSRLLLDQPPAVQAFLRLPFAGCVLRPPQTLSEDALREWGAAYLLEGLQGRVPAWLLARARLWFAGLALPPLTLPMGGSDFDLTCFWSAWNHAAHLS